MRPPRVLTFGEGMLRLSVLPGERLEQARKLDVHSAGSEANVAAALAQIGVDVAWHSRVPESPLGRRLCSELSRAGVDLSQVEWVDGGRIGVFFVELAAPPRPSNVVYDRLGSVASQMSIEGFPWDAVSSAELVHVSGITPAISEGCRELTLEVADRIAQLETRFSLDINYRAKLWGPKEARATFGAMAGKIDLLIVNCEDARDVFGFEGEGHEVTIRLQDEMGAKEVVLSLGDKGAVWRSDPRSDHVPAREATVIDRIGAGDAFAAGVIAGYLDDDLGRGVEMGTVMAALALGMNGDILTTSLGEVTALMQAAPRGVDR